MTLGIFAGNQRVKPANGVWARDASAQAAGENMSAGTSNAPFGTLIWRSEPTMAIEPESLSKESQMVRLPVKFDDVPRVASPTRVVLKDKVVLRIGASSVMLVTVGGGEMKLTQTFLATISVFT
jgi:hypothetical protein